MADCNDCLQARLIDKLSERVDKIEDKQEKMENEISTMKRDAAVNEEQTKMIFKILNEIKESIADINITIQTLKDKPAKRWEDMINTILTVVVSMGAGYVVTLILK